jgi:hypothetical protein
VGGGAQPAAFHEECLDGLPAATPVVDRSFQAKPKPTCWCGEPFQPTTVLWGYTGRSTYTKTSSAQDIDPFAKERSAYLVVYPIVSTQEWT